MSDVTPGRAFHDTVISRRMARGEEPGVIAWQDVPAADKADLEAGAQAVTAVTLAAVTAELRELRDLSARQAHLITRVRGAFSEPDQYGVRHASMTRATFGRFLGEDGHGEAVSPDLSCGRCGSTVTAGRQPGQAPYERYRRAANSLWLSDGNPVMPESVEALPPVLQRAWEAVAGQEPQPDLPVTTPAVTRPAWGDVIVLAVREGLSDESVASAVAALTAATEGEGVTVVTVRGVEALRTWEPQPDLAAAIAELDKVQRGAATLGMVVVRQARDLYAMHIDVSRGDLEAVKQRVLNAIPDVDDNEPAEQWNGTETGSEWLERTRDGS